MKKLQGYAFLVIMLLSGNIMTTNAQILKGFGRKIEKKIEQRIERKADRQVDKVLDKADKKTDEPIDDLLNKPANSKESKNKNSSASPEEKVVVRTDQTMILLGDNCQDLSWFRKGAVLEYRGIDEKGKVEGGYKIQVENLKNEGTATIAEVQATLYSPEYEDIQYPMNYICQGDMIYMDVSSMAKAMMGNSPMGNNSEAKKALENMKMDFSEGFASFPKKMHPGMKLKDLKFSFTTQVAGNEMSFQSTITDRQVIKRETITTAAGTFDCLVIRSVTHSQVKVMGMNQKVPTTTEYLWIAPKVGMVKQESHQGNKIGSSIQLHSYKL